VVERGDVGEGREQRTPAQHALAEVGVEANALPLVRAKRRGLVPHAAGHTDAADVVDERGAA
jgi:hypothetical protein